MRNNTAVVKLERLSTEKITSICENNMNATNVVAPQIEDKITSATARMSIHDPIPDQDEDSPKMDESIIMMPPKVDQIVTVSDDEMDVAEEKPVEEKPIEEEPVVVVPEVEMPPPKTRKARTKKVKTEPDSSVSSSETSNSSVRSTRSKKPKEKLVPRPLLEVKEEVNQRKSNEKSQPPIEVVVLEKVPEVTATTKGVANVTAESVYEDARDVPQKVASPVFALPQVI